MNPERTKPRTSPLALVRAHWGGHPLHILLLLASFALAGYAAMTLLAKSWLSVAIWFAGAAVLLDLLLLPTYALLDRLTQGRIRRARDLPPAPWVNYVRFPVAVSGVLLLVFLPSIARLAGSRFPRTTGLSSAGYLDRWLAVTGALFLLSAILYAVRCVRAVRSRS